MNLAKKGYFVVDNVVYYEGSDVPNRRRLVVPRHLREQLLVSIMTLLMQDTFL